MRQESEKLGSRILDTATAPATSATVSGVGTSSTAFTAADPEEADEGGNEPEEGREEGKGKVGLESAALVTTGRDVAPVKDTATAITVHIDEKAKDNPPEDAHKDIDWPRGKSA